MPEWIWVERISRYRDLETGRFLSGATVREWGGVVGVASGDAMNEMAYMLGDGRLNLRDWTLMMRSEIKDVYIEQYVLARGGLSQMTPQDWGSIGGMLGEQYRYLDRFAREIAEGKLTPSQIARRARMYANSSREALERARRRVNPDAIEVRWIVNPLVENCEDCLAFQAMGWQQVAADPYRGALPGSGHTVCLTNCACYLDYRP